MNSEPIHIGGPTEEALFAWRAGRLHPEAADWIGAHVDGCKRCKSAMDRLDAVHDALEPSPEPLFLRQRQITEVRRPGGGGRGLVIGTTDGSGMRVYVPEEALLEIHGQCLRLTHPLAELDGAGFDRMPSVSPAS